MGTRLADIGSDHALLPVYAVQHDIVASAIAGEVNEGPYEAAAKQVAEAGLKERIEVRLGDGLSVLKEGEADVVTIAGMGGNLIVRILSRGGEPLNAVTTLILQPNVGEETVRRWLHKNGWFLREESIVEEDGKIYEIFSCDKLNESLQQAYDSLYESRVMEGVTVGKDILYKMGPYLMGQADPVFFRKWDYEIAKLQRIENQLASSRLAESVARREAIRQEIRQLKEVLQCLPKDKPLYN